MIFLLSQKLSPKIKAGPLESLPLAENPLTDWSAHLFLAGRTQYIIVSNTKTLYSTATSGRGITNGNEFVNSALHSIQQLMSVDGYGAVFDRWLALASESVCFAKALNCSVTGSMSDMIYHATYWLADCEFWPQAIGPKLNDIPVSALGQGKPGTYG